MERPCYRCGTPIEEHTTFCPSCGAPQIKVTAPDLSPGSPPPAVLPPGTPDSIQPPAVPVQLAPTGAIQWGRFWRIALPLSIINGITFNLPNFVGVVLFVLCVAIAVILYRRHHSGPLLASQGARLGAAVGLLSFVVTLVFSALAVSLDPGEYRKEILLIIQQQAAKTPDPRMQHLVQLAGTTDGLIVITGVLIIATLILFLAFASAIGAVAASLSSNKRR